MRRLAGVGAAHEDDICAGLDTDERAQLGELLERIAARQGLTTGVHPGYRHPGEPRTENLAPGTDAEVS